MRNSCIYSFASLLKNRNILFLKHNHIKHLIPRSYFVHSSNEKTSQPVLVYEGMLKSRIKKVKLLSLTSSMLGFAMLPIIVRDLSQISIALSCGAVVVSSFFLSTPLLLDWVTRRYVTRLRYDPGSDVFTATTFDLLCRERELQFGAADVSVPDVPGLLTSVLVKGRPLFVDGDRVQDPDAYSVMMGYDKPLDLKLSKQDSQ
ncbi:transmembrane protein 70 homolog, mitochondrial [Caerostris darwini]|uniref:Transmembrane protein 70 homolog, mitochondrial n=1 Tax=Caerostris darwini TaxID=1538125 RepID=A0AAV4WII4_9ARAC|nr:transmembrane protein 70 homolog, mitochondrial [Caerostris darwini]